jgi:hypothetical protein
MYEKPQAAKSRVFTVVIFHENLLFFACQIGRVDWISRPFSR